MIYHSHYKSRAARLRDMMRGVCASFVWRSSGDSAPSSSRVLSTESNTYPRIVSKCNMSKLASYDDHSIDLQPPGSDLEVALLWCRSVALLWHLATRGFVIGKATLWCAAPERGCLCCADIFRSQLSQCFQIETMASWVDSIARVLLSGFAPSGICPNVPYAHNDPTASRD
jgi:hypothetical protein